MTKREKKILTALIRKMQDDLPDVWEECGCSEDDGDTECDFHRINRRLDDFAEGVDLEEIAAFEKLEV
jgi:hypothetical protein